MSHDRLPLSRSTSMDGYARLLDLLPGLVVYFGPDLRYRYANHPYARWRGLDAATIVGRECREVVGEADFLFICGNLQKALEGKTVTCEYDISDSGYKRRVQGSYVPDIDDAGAVVGIVVLITDISTRNDLLDTIAEAKAVFDQAFDNSSLGMAVVEPSGQIERVNLAFADMLCRPPDALIGISFRDITHPDDLDSDNGLFGEVLSGKRNGYTMYKRYLRPDRSAVEAHLTVTVTRAEDGNATHFVAHIEDVTERRQAERRLRQDAARMTLAMDAVRGGFWHLDVVTNVFETSSKLAHYVDGPDAPLLGLQTYSARIAEEDLHVADLAPMITGCLDHASVEYRLHTSSGLRWARCDRRLVRDREGRPEQIVGVVTDITEEQEQRRISRAEAETDPITGLLNRRGLDRHFARLGHSSPCGVIAIDLDRFKLINDRHGHQAGDAVLIECARRLRAEMRATDLVARTGGDEFLVILPHVAEHMLAAIGERIAVTFAEPFLSNGILLAMSGSVGAAWSVETPPDLRRLSAAADRALYQVKTSERGRWRMAG